MKATSPPAWLDAFAEGLRARVRLNAATGDIHPDPAVRATARARADAYRVSLLDLRVAYERAWKDGL